MTPSARRGDVVARLDDLDVDPVYGCRLWGGEADADGYGVLRTAAGRVLAHRAAYEAANGKVPPGMELDHLCRRRACCAPSHLEVVSRRINERRKSLKWRLRTTHCPAGHSLYQHGRMTPEGGKVCLYCTFGEARGRRNA